jgi:hypothetical protein
MSLFKETDLITAAITELKAFSRFTAESDKTAQKNVLEQLSAKGELEQGTISLAEVMSLATLLKKASTISKNTNLKESIKSPLLVHQLLEGSEYIAPKPEKKVLVIKFCIGILLSHILYRVANI